MGIVAKNPPFAAPFMMTKAISGPRDFETGQMTNMLRALIRSDIKRVFIGPMTSLPTPHISRPIADEKLKAATKPAPALEENPREFA